MLESLLIGVAGNFLTAAIKGTVGRSKKPFSDSELKSVLNQAYKDFKESYSDCKVEKEERHLLKIFEEFFNDDRTIGEFQLVFEGQSQRVDFNLLEEIFFDICMEKGIDTPGFNFSRAMSHMLEAIEALAQKNEELRNTFKIAHLKRLYLYLQKRGEEPNFTYARQKYLKQLILHNQRLDFSGMPDLKETRDVTIPSVFVKQRAVEHVPVRDYEQFMRENCGEEEIPGEEIQLRGFIKPWGEEKKDPVKFNEVFSESENRRFVILGKPGSGKSTLLKYIMLKIVNEQIAGHRAAENLLFPILVEIRKFENALARIDKPEYNIMDYLYDSMRQDYQVTLPMGFFEKYLESGKALLMFDGLDEVASEARRANVRQMISAFVTNYNNRNIAIVTSRIAGYNRVRFSTAEYRHFTLEDFNDEEIDEFIHKWYRSRLTKPNEIAAKAGELERAIEKKPRLKELAKNPMLLTIIAIIHRNNAQLPEDRLILYEKATEALLYTWDNIKEIIDDKFKLEDKRRFLENVAFHLQSMEKGDEAGTMMERHDVYKILFPDFCRIFGVDKRQAKGLVDEFLDKLRTRTGLLVELAPDQYGFVHKTFQEYFAAKYIYNETYLNFDLEIMLNYADRFMDNAFWHETLLLALKALPNKQTKKVLEHILTHDPKKIEKYFYHNCYFVMKAIAELGQWLDNKEFVERAIDDFFNFSLNDCKDRSYCSNKTWDRFKNWMSSVTCSSVHLYLSNKLLSLAGDKEWDGRSRLYCAEALGHLNMADKAANILLEMVEDSRLEVWLRHDCAKAIGNMGVKNMAAINRLLSIIENIEQDGWLRVTCAMALGNLGVEDNTVIDRLLVIIEDTRQECRIRRSCIETLGKLGVKDKAVIKRLQAIAINSRQDSWLRFYCAEALGKLGIKDKALQQLFLIAEDPCEDSRLRRSCVEALGNLGVNDKAVTDRLLTIADDIQKDGWLKGTCAIVVGNLGVKDNALIDRLLAIAEDRHEDGGVRRYCAEALGDMGVKDKNIVDRLMAIIEDRFQDNWVRSACVTVVGKLGMRDKILIDRLTAFAEDKRQDRWFRYYCAMVVSVLGVKDKAEELLLILAEDEKMEILLRGRCAGIVGKLNEKDKAIAILVDLYTAQKDQYNDVARSIYDSLWDLTSV